MISDELYDEAEVWEDREAEYAIERPIMPHNPLLAWALTCRAFTEPALDVLWRYLENPYPIGFAFQPNVQPVFGSDHDESDDENEDGEDHGTNKRVRGYFVIGFSTIPSAADWNRFRSRYAKRIRAIEYWDNHKLKYGISPRFLAELTAYRPSGDLIPNLRSSRWEDENKDVFPFFTLFLTSTLTSVTVLFQSNTNAIKFCHLAQLFTPALQKVNIVCSSFDTRRAMRTIFTQTLSSWSSLRSFQTTDEADVLPMSTEDIMALSQCNKLQDLDVVLECDLSPAIYAFFTRTNTFISLRKLKIRFVDSNAGIVPFTTRMVQAIRSQDFQSLNLEIWDTFTSAEIYNLLCAVGTHRRLRSLHLSFSTSIDKDIIIVPNETIEPLFQLSNLVEFDMRGLPLQLGITKELLGKMAQSWSNISSLRYHSGLSLASETASLPPLDITCLETLANLCPKLKTLSIPFSSTLNGDIIHDFHFLGVYLPAQRASNTVLTLNVAQCAIVSKMAAALFLTRLYPQLDVSPYREEWEKKIRLISQLRRGMYIP
ncbi:hypothetical protein QCA50_010415 [Cerrena zonata]|uniref:Uncharacterized protein n=1 Tax=Cerrena zonata TaxID=2478898 RepID=A0AAW0G4W7_9APHY